MADQDRGGQRSAPELVQELGLVGGDQLGQFAFERVDLAGEGTDLRELRAGDPDTRAGPGASQPTVEALEVAQVRQRPGRELRLDLRADVE